MVREFVKMEESNMKTDYEHIESITRGLYYLGQLKQYVMPAPDHVLDVISAGIDGMYRKLSSEDKEVIFKMMVDRIGGSQCITVLDNEDIENMGTEFDVLNKSL